MSHSTVGAISPWKNFVPAISISPNELSNFAFLLTRIVRKAAGAALAEAEH